MIKLLETWQGIRSDSQNHIVCSIYVNTTFTQSPSYVYRPASQNWIRGLASLCPIPYLLMTLSVISQQKVLTQTCQGCTRPGFFFPSTQRNPVQRPKPMLLHEWPRAPAPHQCGG